MERLECNVELPREWRDTYFQERGPVVTSFHERRRFRRHNVRAKTVLEVGESLPAIPRETAFYAVYSRDFSRNSMSFLHVEELFPNEVVHVWLPKSRRAFRVVSCRRMNDRCYLVGAVMVDDGELDAKNELPQAATTDDA